MLTKFQSESQAGKNYLGDAGVDENIILNWILRNIYLYGVLLNR
jgi:hypothetical protein